MNQDSEQGIDTTRLATVGVFGAALFAASCCVSPTLFLLFGISASALTPLAVVEPFRPLFIGAGIVALGFAGWRIWGPAPAASGADGGDGACAPNAPARRNLRTLFWIAAGVFGVAVTYPYIVEQLI